MHRVLLSMALTAATVLYAGCRATAMAAEAAEVTVRRPH